MQINTLSLKNFRNHKKITISFKPHLTAVIGKNTSGKTNLLEALTLLSYGKSGRGAADLDLVEKGKESAFIAGEFKRKENFQLEVRLFINPQTKRLQKKYLRNNLSTTQQNFAGNLLIVNFSPDDLRIIADSPGTRRAFLNLALTQVDPKYRKAQSTYELVIRSRNAILEKIKNGMGRREELFYWDKLAIENGNYLTKKREELVKFINSVRVGLAPALGRLRESPLHLHVVYDRSEISPDRLSQYAEAEISATSTLVGPHRDDLQFFDKSRNLKIFGSRGEQRLAVLFLKLRELEYVKEISGEKPVLLLDDIFSELDETNRKLALNLIQDHQTILTTADEKDLEYLGDFNFQKIYLGQL